MDGNTATAQHAVMLENRVYTICTLNNTTMLFHRDILSYTISYYGGVSEKPVSSRIDLNPDADSGTPALA